MPRVSVSAATGASVGCLPSHLRLQRLPDRQSMPPPAPDTSEINGLEVPVHAIPIDSGLTFERMVPEPRGVNAETDNDMISEPDNDARAEPEYEPSVDGASPDQLDFLRQSTPVSDYLTCDASCMMTVDGSEETNMQGNVVGWEEELSTMRREMHAKEALIAELQQTVGDKNALLLQLSVGSLREQNLAWADTVKQVLETWSNTARGNDVDTLTRQLRTAVLKEVEAHPGMQYVASLKQ